MDLSDSSPTSNPGQRPKRTYPVKKRAMTNTGVFSMTSFTESSCLACPAPVGKRVRVNAEDTTKFAGYPNIRRNKVGRYSVVGRPSLYGVQHDRDRLDKAMGISVCAVPNETLRRGDGHKGVGDESCQRSSPLRSPTSPKSPTTEHR